MSITAMKQALEALENCTTWSLTREQFDKNVTAITALRPIIDAYTLASDPGSLRLRGTKSQPQQEPAGTVKELFTIAAWERLDVVGSTKVYLGTPPAAQRQWVGLTGEELATLFEKYGHKTGELVGAVEDKLKEKNT
jgi:hypothetical protein